MKHPAFITLAVLLAFCVESPLVVQAQAGGPTNSEQAELFGRGLGIQDARAGRPAAPERYRDAHGSNQQDAFERGYESGYKFVTGETDRKLRTADVLEGEVVVKSGTNIVCRLRPAGPTVEKTLFLNEGSQLAVRSRASDGHATCQLFDLGAQTETARVMASQIKEGEPAWAASLAD